MKKLCHWITLSIKSAKGNQVLMKTTFIIFMFLFTIPTLRAQQFKECGTVVSKQQLERELQRMSQRKMTVAEFATDLVFHLPLAIHIVRRSNGTGGIRSGQLDTALTDLNKNFEQAGIQFHRYGNIDIIDNDHFFNIPNNQAIRDELRSQNVVQNAINVYFTNLTELCGEATFPTGDVQGVLINNDCTGTADNPSTFAHEVGHYLDLYHTHETEFGVECPSGSNGDTAGDLIADTPADPNLTKTDNTYRVDANCTYDNSATLPSGCGVTPYSPQTNNLMSYSRKPCRNFFSTGQITRMAATLILGGSRSNLLTNMHYVGPNAFPVQLQMGTPQFPYTTIARALRNAKPGDFIFIYSGNYPENLTIGSEVHEKNVTLKRWDTNGNVVIGTSNALLSGIYTK